VTKRKYDIVVKAGERPDGKAIWKNVGVMMEGDNGPFWNVVEEVLRPNDLFKAYVAKGSRYGLDDAWVKP
jgi:hypothetical protein